MTAYVKEENSLSLTKLNKSRNILAFRKALLDWYAQYQREMPWRARESEVKNPYYTWLSEIMLQQTTVQAVIPYFVKFIQKWPDIHALAKADDDEVMAEWAGLGYYARARNLLKCARTISGSDFKGRFPESIEGLQGLPGVGPYTAAAIRAIAFNKPSVVVDGNIERVISRLFNIKTPLPQSKKTITKKAELLSSGLKQRPGDYAQALMDLGAMICTPRAPKCDLCPVRAYCEARQAGTEKDIPYKTPRKKKPLREGVIYWIEDGHGRVLLEKRPEKRMLGNMTGLPGSSWDNPGKTGALPAELKEILRLNGTQEGGYLSEEIKHSFTHFNLTLKVALYHIDKKIKTPDPYFFITKKELLKLGLPSLYKKAVSLAL